MSQQNSIKVQFFLERFPSSSDCLIAFLTFGKGKPFSACEWIKTQKTAIDEMSSRWNVMQEIDDRLDLEDFKLQQYTNRVDIDSKMKGEDKYQVEFIPCDH